MRARRRLRRLLAALGGWLILAAWAVDCILHPDPEDPT